MPKQKEHNLRILQWNVRSFESNKAIILKALDVIKPDVLCLQETNGKNHQNFNLTGYKCVARKDRAVSTGGGVAIFTKRELATTEIEVQLEIEAVAVNVHVGEKVHQIFSIYLPPNTDNNLIKESLEKILYNVCQVCI